MIINIALGRDNFLYKINIDRISHHLNLKKVLEKDFIKGLDDFYLKQKHLNSNLFSILIIVLDIFSVNIYLIKPSPIAKID